VLDFGRRHAAGNAPAPEKAVLVANNAEVARRREAESKVANLEACNAWLLEHQGAAEIRTRELGNEVSRLRRERVADQRRIGAWVETRFGRDCLEDGVERALRVLEEASELAQAEGVPEEQARRVCGAIYAKPVGDPDQEAAGVFVTLLGWGVAARRVVGDLRAGRR
jgi:hypothetical protein